MRDHIHMLEPALSEIAANMSPHHPDYWTRLEHQAAIQLHPVIVRDWLADPQLIGQIGERWPDGAAADAAKHARALIARLKGETE